MNTNWCSRIAWLCLATGPALCAMPTGPGVYAQPVAGALRLNGLRVELAHLQGPGLAALLEAARQQWVTAAAAPAMSRIGAWQVLTRQTATHSEVLQWKGEGPELMALYSRLDHQQWVRPRPQFAWGLPEACRWQQTLESTLLQQRTVQGTAWCNGAVSNVLPRLRATLAADGWLLSQGGAHFPLVWRKAPLQLQVVLTDTRDASQSPVSALVAIQTAEGGS